MSARSKYVPVTAAEAYARDGAERPVCDCHDELKKWNSDSGCRRGGYYSCSCRANAASAVWRKANPELCRMQERRWVRANPEKVASYSRKTYLRNREETLAKQAAYRLANRERVISMKADAISRRWEKDPLKMIAQEERRRTYMRRQRLKEQINGQVPT